jgi:hypothetical protein
MKSKRDWTGLARGAMVAFAVVLASAVALGQSPPNLPPAGVYQPVPNYTGVDAGLQFRTAINDRFSGVQPISPAIVNLAIANLPTEQDGLVIFCRDCQRTTPCVAGGAGAWALGERGVWRCSSGALEGDLNANGHKVAGLAAGSASGDTLAFGQSGAVLNTLGGAKLDGSDVISNFNVNGVVNVQAFGAVCTSITESAAATAGNATITVGAIGDFKVGQHVKLDHAGAANSLATPTLTSVSRDGYGLNSRPTAEITGLDNPATPNGNCLTDSLGSAPGHNASCTTTYGYTIQAAGQTGIGTGLNGMLSDQSAIVYIDNAPATMSAANHTILKWTSSANAVAYIIRRCSGGSCTPNAASIYAVIPENPYYLGDTMYYLDMGNTFGHSETTLTGSATAADLDTYITNISGTTVTLNAAPSQTGTVTMHHDNSVAFQNAINAASLALPNQSASAFVPACATSYPLSQALTFYGLNGAGLEGWGHNIGQQIGGSQIQWDGPIGGIVINGNWSNSTRIRGIAFNATGTFNTPGIFIDIDGYGDGTPGQSGPGNTSATGSATPTHWQISDDEIAEASMCVNFGGVSNVENVAVDNVYCDGPGYIGYWSNSQETYDEVIRNGQISNHDFGTYFNRIGSFSIENTNQESNKINFRIGSISNYGRISGGVSEGAQYFLYGGPGAAANQEIDSWRVAGGSTPAGYVIFGGGSFYNMNFEGNGGIASYNISGPNLIVGSYFGAALSNLNGSGGAYLAQPGNLPITTSSGTLAQPQYTVINSAVTGSNLPPLVVEQGTSGTNASLISGGNTTQQANNGNTVQAFQRAVDPSEDGSGASAALSGNFLDLWDTLGTSIGSIDLRARAIFRGLTVNAHPRLMGVVQANGAAGASVTVNVPATVVNGDLMIAAVSSSADNHTETCPAGWNLILNESDSAHATLLTCSRVASSEPASYTFTPPNGSTRIGAIYDFAGAAAVEASNGATGGIAASLAIPAPATAQAGDAILAIAGNGECCATVSPPTNEEVASSYSSGINWGAGIYYPAAASQTFTWSGNSWTVGQQIALTLGAAAISATGPIQPGSTNYANLPATATNGQRWYCTNCDPPANPPVTCTSAGAKTGAFADGVNGAWLCVP